jgi:hypothetical protein
MQITVAYKGEVKTDAVDNVIRTHLTHLGEAVAPSTVPLPRRPD